MPYNRRFPAAPQLEVIHASDATTRAELIALPVRRTARGDHAAGARAAVLAPTDAGEPPPAA